ncbi:hypothetical protein ACSN7Q_002408 [Flavobacterium psychrophilum]
MTKEEKIQEAYINCWDDFKDYVDENGFLNCVKNRKLSLIPYFEVSEIEFKGNLVRPKSLSGLEGNNGWIKIKSVGDFPKKDLECYVTNNIGRIQFAEFELENQRFYVENLRMYPTHYQPIIKPDYPLY